MTSENLKAVLKELETQGAVEIEVEHGSKHLRVYYTFGGDRRFYVLSKTPSDRRAPLNSVRDLRRQMGVNRIVHKRKGPKRKRIRYDGPAEPDKLTTFADALKNGIGKFDPFEARIRLAEYRLSFFAGSYDEWERMKYPTKMASV